MHSKDITTPSETPRAARDVTFAEVAEFSAKLRRQMARVERLKFELARAEWELDQLAATGKGAAA